MQRILILLLAIGLTVTAQTTTGELTSRLESLEGRVPASPIGQADLEVFRDQMETKLEKERNHTDKLFQDLENKLLAIRETNLIFKLLTGFLAFIGVSGFIMLYVHVRRLILDEVGSQLAANRPNIQKWIEEANLDLQTKQESSVLIFSNHGDWLGKQLRDFGFLRVATTTVEDEHRFDPDKLSHHASDIAIFDELPSAWINGYLMHFRDRIALCYSTGPQLVLEPAVRPRVAFANSTFSLFSRLMEVVRFLKLGVKAR